MELYVGISNLFRLNARDQRTMSARGKRDGQPLPPDAVFRQGVHRTKVRTTTRPAPAANAGYRKDLSLSDLQPGECGAVLRLNGNFCGRLRLLEMGLTPGTMVRMVRAAAFGGPVDIEVRGYQLSLRREEAAQVWLGDEQES